MIKFILKITINLIILHKTVVAETESLGESAK